MQHVDPDVLALWALGEDEVASPDDRAHLEACAECRAERDALTTAAETGRSAEPLVAPPAEVWERVRAAIGAETGDPAADRSAGGAEIVGLSSRRRNLAWAGVAAGVALVAGVAGGVLWERAQEPAPAPVAVATAVLDALPDWPGSTGSATVEEEVDGTREIVVSVNDGDVSGSAYREVWLLAADLSGMVSLGVLEGDEGSFPVPDGIDLETYSVVDVSSEPLDGDPVHSGDSIVRGALGPV